MRLGLGDIFNTDDVDNNFEQTEGNTNFSNTLYYTVHPPCLSCIVLDGSLNVMNCIAFVDCLTYPFQNTLTLFPYFHLNQYIDGQIWLYFRN